MSWIARSNRERFQLFKATKGPRGTVAGVQEAKKCPKFAPLLNLLARNISNWDKASNENVTYVPLDQLNIESSFIDTQWIRWVKCSNPDCSLGELYHLLDQFLKVPELYTLHTASVLIYGISQLVSKESYSHRFSFYFYKQCNSHQILVYKAFYNNFPINGRSV